MHWNSQLQACLDRQKLFSGMAGAFLFPQAVPPNAAGPPMCSALPGSEAGV
jgi:hypothetical protein